MHDCDAVKEQISDEYLKSLPFKAQGDLCLSFWSLALANNWINFPQNAKVLEIGCAEADWQTPMLALRPDLQITGIDWRACKRPGTTIQGDVMKLDTFEHASFDAIVSISAIEHVGLGAYDEDPLFAIGDTVTMSNAHYWLKPKGWMYLDVPFDEQRYSANGQYRRYDEGAIGGRLLSPGFVVRRWAHCNVNHPDTPYMALLLDKV